MEPRARWCYPPPALRPNRAAPRSVATLSMDKDQTLRLEGKPLAAADLGKELLDLARTRPETGVLVQMHRELPVQALVELMDQLRAAGISRTAVATNSKSGMTKMSAQRSQSLKQVLSSQCSVLPDHESTEHFHASPEPLSSFHKPHGFVPMHRVTLEPFGPFAFFGGVWPCLGRGRAVVVGHSAAGGDRGLSRGGFGLDVAGGFQPCQRCGECRSPSFRAGRRQHTAVRNGRRGRACPRPSPSRLSKRWRSWPPRRLPNRRRRPRRSPRLWRKQSPPPLLHPRPRGIRLLRSRCHARHHHFNPCRNTAGLETADRQPAGPRHAGCPGHWLRRRGTKA